MAPKKVQDEKVKMELYVPMTTYKRLVLWGWVKGQTRPELCSNIIAARAESNEEQFMRDIADRARDMSKTPEDLIQEIFDEAELAAVPRVKDEDED